MKKLSCIIIDDDPLAVDRMENLLHKTAGTSSVLKLCAPGKAVQLILSHRPDIVFLEIEMQGMSGFDLINQVHYNLFFPTFIFTTAYNQYAIRAIKAEAFDFLLKPIDIDELKETMTRYQNSRKNIHLPEQCCLSPRETEILEYVTKGKTSREIAEELHLSKHTVDTHRRKIGRKMK
ncbi:MAG: response regulator transcription factor [Mangrovibacterium sp.]|nr:response regulator transcription factor [Mangrovibacterium sp.]